MNPCSIIGNSCGVLGKPCEIIRNCEIIFDNLAVMINPPHMPFQAPLIIILTLDFGNGAITTATYQAIGDNKTDSTIYMQGGGGISIHGDSRVFTGASRFNGNIHYTGDPQRLVSQYNGPVQISQQSSEKAVLVAELAATGQGPLMGKTLKASLNGEATISTNCGLKTIRFSTSSLKLAILLPT